MLVETYLDAGSFHFKEKEAIILMEMHSKKR